MPEEGQGSSQPNTQPVTPPAPNPIPPIKPDLSTILVCQKSNGETNTRETATKAPPKK